MTDTYLAIQTLGFATGAVLFGLLAWLSRKADRLAGHRDFSLNSAWLGLLWNAGMLVEYMARVAGIRLSLRPLRLVSAAAYSALALLPTIFLIDALNRYEERQPLRGKRWLLVSSCVIAALLTLNLIVIGLGFSVLLSWPVLLKTIAYNLVLHLAVIFFLFQRTQNFPERAFVRAELWFLVGLAVTLMLSIHLAFNTPVETVIRVISQQSGIPIALTAIASLSRFRFADVFIKRGFTILAAVVTVLIYSLFVIRPLLRLVRASARYPEAASWVVMTLFGCLLLLVFPLIKDAIYLAADRLLFRRPAYPKLLQIIASESDQAENEQQLFAIVEEQVRAALGAERVSIIPYDELRSNEAGGLKIEHRVPVQTRGLVTHQVAIAPGLTGRKLLSDELAFLSSIAERVGRRLEALHYERERRLRELREARLQQSLTEAELRALQAQINPHFLFNTLNAIAGLIGSEPEKAEAMTERLAEVFRYVLAQSETSLISVREEFDFLQTYLAIEQARFGERLRVEMAVDPAAAQFQIPPLLLQPIVENAIKHGLAPKREGGRLDIRAECINGFCRLIVADDGAGWNHLRPATSAGGTGVGLKNVRDRLQTVYDGRAELRVDSTEQGTQISIIIPNHEAQNFDRGRRSSSAIAFEEAGRRAS